MKFNCNSSALVTKMRDYEETCLVSIFFVFCIIVLFYFDVSDKQIIKKTGRILMSTDLGGEYGFVDVDG